MTDEERLALLEKQEAEEKAELDQLANPSMRGTDRARLFGQGATLGFADEIIAGVRALSPNVTYKDALFEERQAIKNARKDFPVQSLAMEGAGGLTTGLLSAPFTLGASLPATAVRLALIGGTTGAAYGLGTGEGEGTGLELKERLSNVPINAAIGAVANPIVGKTLDVARKGGGMVIDRLSRSKFFNKGELPKAVESEVMRYVRMVDETGETPIDQILDDVIERIGKGEVIADMSDATQNALSGLYARNTTGVKSQIKTKLTARADDLRKEAFDEIDVGLRGESSNNIVKAINSKIDTLKAEESNAYNRIFESAKGQKFPMIDNVVLGIASKSEKARSVLNNYFDSAGLPKLFKKNKDGSFALNRSLTLKEGEFVKRAFMDEKKEVAQGAAKNRSNLFRGYEREIKDVLDELSPDLKATRTKWATIEATNKAFLEARKLFGKSSDEMENAFNDIVSTGSPEIVAGFRAGIAAQLKNKLETGQKASLMGILNDLDRKERRILEIVYPTDDLTEAIAKIKLASQAQQTKNIVTGGSKTAKTQIESKAVGSSSNMANIGEFAATQNPFALLRLVRDNIPKGMANLTPEQESQVASFVLSDNAPLVAEALTNANARNVLQQKISQAISRLTASTAQGSTVGLLGAGSEPMRAASSLGTSLLGVQ